MCRCVIAVLKQQSNQLWWIMGMCDKLFDALLKNCSTEIEGALGDATTDRDPIVNAILFTPTHP